jgi:hypothetical protein
VEVLGRYSNHADQEERIRRVLELGPEAHSGANSRPPKQVQRRLRPDEIDDLVAQYLAGETIQALAAHHYIHRFTVSQILDRRQIPRRSKGIPPERLSEVIRRYEAGDSMVTIAKLESVSPETIRLALQRSGSKIRRRKGWA